MEIIAAPASIPVSILSIPHPEYRADKLQLHDALYRGGDEFDAIKKDILKRRDIESSNLPAGTKLREGRLASAQYTPHAAGLLDFLMSCVFQSEPSFLASVKAPQAVAGDDVEQEPAEDKTDPKAAFWHSLNENADGSGNDLPCVLKSALKSALLHGRGYLSICFDGNMASAASTAGDFGQVRETGVLDTGTISALSACQIDDWGRDDDGELEFVRLHAVDLIRSSPFAPYDSERHCWTIVDSERVSEYQAVRKLDANGRPEAWAEGAVAALVSSAPHGLDSLPVIEIRLPSVMQRLSATAIALFNREASLTWALDQSAFSQLCFFTDKNLNELIVSEISALKFNPADKVEFKSPDSSMFASLRDDCERLIQNLYLSVQSMALQAASKDQNGRQSGVAKVRDWGSIYILLSSYAAALLDVTRQAVELLRLARGDEDVTISVHGLDEYDIDSADKKIQIAQQFLALPGIPDAARRWLLASTSLAVCNSAPPEIREQIKRQAESDEEPEPEPKIVAIAPPANPDDQPDEENSDDEKESDSGDRMKEHDRKQRSSRGNG